MSQGRNFALILLDRRYWIGHFLFVAAICIAGLYYLGYSTYEAAPPVANFVGPTGELIISKSEIDDGQQVFLRRGLMTYGTFWGDGAERGPDFTAEAIRQMTLSMRGFYGAPPGVTYQDSVGLRIMNEFRTNGWNQVKSEISVSGGMAHAFEDLNAYYQRAFRDRQYENYIRLGFELSSEEVRKLTAFFYWGAWVAVANRPGENYSYTLNWPHDPAVGNYPTSGTILWSVISILVLFLGVGLVLYVYGQMKVILPDPFTTSQSEKEPLLTTSDLERQIVRPTQRSTYKFFALAMVLFGLQLLAGIFCATDFVRPFGIFLGDLLPFTVARSYHTLFQIFWFFMCWVGYTIFFLPKLAPVPQNQRFLVNLLFILCLIVGAGALFGIYAGHKGILTGEAAYWFGSQGWEFMELGRLFQIILLVAFSLWIFIIYRAVKPWLTKKNLWSVPAWLLYGSGIMVLFLFFGLLVAPRTNFAVADYWRWMVVHMWVEVTFEVFTTVIVAYIMVQMNFVQRVMAERAIFLAVMMFLLTATIGISHNFYWIAKPTAAVALGSVFSTTQVLPLLLLTLDAWAMRKKGEFAQVSSSQSIVMNEVWLFILAVNFWNVFGAGVFGSLINLPIVNYFEHATYLTNNHAHGAMFGVKGNVALAGMLFCCQHLFPRSVWSAKILRFSFWSLNIGIAMMMFMDLFPVGVYQMIAVVEKGLWYARSAEIVNGTVFKTLTYLRSIGGTVFVFGGFFPLAWFVVSNANKLLPETEVTMQDQPEIEKSWSDQNSRN